MKIGSTTWNVEAIKQMTFEEFAEQFKGKVDRPLDSLYETITGEKIGKIEKPKAEKKVIGVKIKKEKE